MKYALPNAEQEVLNFLWKNKKWTTCSELVQHFNRSGRDWKRQTINTFLTRLLEKGFVIKNGRKYIYTYSEEEFASLKAAELIESFYNGSLKTFMSALTGKNTLDKKYADELKEYLEELTDNE